MLQIKRASELTGIPEATLRIWERRYGLGASHRSESGYRLYDDLDLLRIKEMQNLIEEGWLAKEAAEKAKNQISENSNSVDKIKINTLQVLSDKFFEAINNLNVDLLNNVLDQAFSEGSFEFVIDNWLSPTMMLLGEKWRKGEASIASEHFASNAIMRRLSATFENAGQSQFGPKMIIGAPSGSAHEIGALVFAATARRRGYQVMYLGVDIPADSWAEAVQTYNADVVVISAKYHEDLSIIQECINKLSELRPKVKIVIGGNSKLNIRGADLTLSGTLSHSMDQLATAIQSE